MAPGHWVTVSEGFAEELGKQFPELGEGVIAGPHWGTTVLHAQSVEFTAAHAARLRTRSDLFRIYLGDVVLGNSDRTTQGNVLLLKDGRAGFDVIPIDQSDCFDHPSGMRNANHLKSKVASSLAKALPGLDGVVLEAGEGFPEREIRRVQEIKPVLVNAARVPDPDWYGKAGVSSTDLADWLGARIDNLPELARLSLWEGMGKFNGDAYELL